MVEKNGKLENLLYLVILPVTFTTILLLIIFIFMGYPVGKTLISWGNNVPVLNHIVPGSAVKETAASPGAGSGGQKAETSTAGLKDKEQEISDLKQQLESSQKQLSQLKQTNLQLEKQLETKQSEALKEQMEKTAALYQNIPSAKAAAMLESMTIEDAVLTMAMLEEDEQSKIIASMKDAKKAADMTMILKGLPIETETDQEALKEKVQEMAQLQASPTQTLAETIAAMPAEQSASMIQSMMESNAQVAMELMKNISTANRSQILTEIAKADAGLAAQITAGLN
ncbi:hypothetical protein [Neobacillus muris]|uniref:hypothetical protein n=1 Tax=Neobacillus muris TaxID=2941334 RepID=UPI00204008DB|nr:hypothetical protein [Neobacillus muris]